MTSLTRSTLTGLEKDAPEKKNINMGQSPHWIQIFFLFYFHQLIIYNHFNIYITMPIYNQENTRHHHRALSGSVNAIKSYMNRNKPDMNDPINRTDKDVSGSAVQTAASSQSAEIPHRPVQKKPTMIDLVTNQFVTDPDYSGETSTGDAIPVLTFAPETSLPLANAMNAAPAYVSDVDDSDDDNYYVFSSRGLRYGAPVPMQRTHKSSRSNSERSRKRPSFESMVAAMANRSSSQPPNRMYSKRTPRSFSQPPNGDQPVMHTPYQPSALGYTGTSYQQQSSIDVAPAQQPPNLQQLPSPLSRLLAPLIQHLRSVTPRQDLRAAILATEVLAAIMVVNWINNNSGTVLLLVAIMAGLAIVGRKNTTPARR